MEQYAQQTHAILMTTVSRVLDYKNVFQNDAQMREFLQPILKKFLDTMILTFLDDNMTYEHMEEDLTFYERDHYRHYVPKLVTKIQASTGLDTRSLVTVLKALAFSNQVPDNLQQQADTCFKILREFLIGTLDTCEEVIVDTPFDEVYLNISKLDNDQPTIEMYIQLKDVEKVTDIVSGLSGLSLSKRKLDTDCSRVDTYVEFPFTEHNVEMFTHLLQCMSKGPYDIGKTICINFNGFGLNYLNLGNFDDDMKFWEMLIDEDFYERFQETHFNKVISLT